MRKFVFLLVAAAVSYGCWFFFQNYQIRGLDSISFSPRSGADARQDREAGLALPSVSRQGGTIRIASFNIQVFGEKKTRRPASSQPVGRNYSPL
jgi:deoxyribonuclease-1-like protein